MSSPKQDFPWQQRDGSVYLSPVKALERAGLFQEGPQGRRVIYAAAASVKSICIKSICWKTKNRVKEY